MPELPEVEAARNLVQQWCIGQRVTDVIVADDDKVIQGISPKELQQALVGRTVRRSCRKGKQMWLTFDEGPALMLHLGMTGHVAVRGKESLKYMLAKAVDVNEWPPKYAKVQLSLSEGTHLAFCDSRRFAKVKFLDNAAREAALPGGWDALNEQPTQEEVAAQLGKRRAAIKSVLLDQAVYAGIGNWCADDILFTARIHPEEQACNLTGQQLEALRSATQSVMRVAVGCGAESDKYPSEWLFHSRWAPKKAPSHVSFLTIGGRTTALDVSLQRLNVTAEQPSLPEQQATQPRIAEHTAAEADDMRKSGQPTGAEATTAKLPAVKLKAERKTAPNTAAKPVTKCSASAPKTAGQKNAGIEASSKSQKRRGPAEEAVLVEEGASDGEARNGRLRPTANARATRSNKPRLESFSRSTRN